MLKALSIILYRLVACFYISRLVAEPWSGKIYFISQVFL
jgi:hypothetical protein